MKHLILTLGILTATIVNGTSVEWGLLACYPTSDDAVLLNSTRIDLDISFFLWYSDGFFSCSPNMDRKGSIADIQTYVSGAWVESQKGEIVNKESLLRDGVLYLINETFGSLNSLSSYTFGNYDPNTSQYLKFIVQDRAEVVAYLNGGGKDPATCYTGWIEYKIDDSGKFNILNSAIDFDGGAMIVGAGAVPEPTSGLLMLLGVAGLALRRKRV